MERTNASTTGALALDGTWATDLLEPLGLSAAIFADLVLPGTYLGNACEPRAAAAGLSDTAVVAPATHDTASAVAGLPIAPQATGDAAAFISCGTWSLLGIERAAPIATEAARRAGFTNETGVAGTTRFLTNIMGLWIVQECRRAWARRVPQNDEDFWAALAAQTPTGSVVDVDDPALLNPEDMPSALAAQLRRNGEEPVIEPLRLARAVCEGLALRYRACLREAQSLAEVRVRALHLVGGGARSALLCRLTADACEIPVIAGPSEATGYGNLLVQLIAAGGVRDLAQGRELVRRSATLTHYEPHGEPSLHERAERLGVLRARMRGLTIAET
jgi:rhamnulokinase